MSIECFEHAEERQPRATPSYSSLAAAVNASGTHADLGGTQRRIVGDTLMALTLRPSDASPTARAEGVVQVIEVELEVGELAFCTGRVPVSLP